MSLDMDIYKYDEFYRIVQLLEDIKELYDSGDTKIVDDIADCPLDEELETMAYEYIYSADFLINYDYDEENECGEMVFSSDDMVQYYKLARKIGKLKGWNDENNPYILRAEGYDLELLEKIDGTYISGLLYTKPDKKHRISWEMEMYCEFYEYWELYFAMRVIFHNYSTQKDILKREYRKLLKEKKQGLEAAA